MTNEWMIVYTTHNLGEAHIVVGRLESEGIPAILDHMAGMNAIGISIGTWGEVRVLVNPDNFAQASAVLFPDDPPELEDDTSDITYHWGDDEE